MSRGLTTGGVFAGIGGLELGLERAGYAIVWQVERDPFCRQILSRHWPEVERHCGIEHCDFTELTAVDLIAGGPPCQPVSTAGKMEAQDDPNWLWPEFARAIRVVRPRFVLVENVSGLLVRGIQFDPAVQEGEIV